MFPDTLIDDDDRSEDIFPVSLTVKTEMPGPTETDSPLAGKFVYDWVEQTWDAFTGEYEDAEPGRLGNFSVDGFSPALELNNQDVTVPTIAWLRLRGVANGDHLFEFYAGRADHEPDGPESKSTRVLTNVCWDAGVLSQDEDGVVLLDDEPIGPEGVQVIVALTRERKTITASSKVVKVGAADCDSDDEECCPDGDCVETTCCSCVSRNLTFTGTAVCWANGGADQCGPTNPVSIPLTYVANLDGVEDAWVSDAITGNPETSWIKLVCRDGAWRAFRQGPVDPAPAPPVPKWYPDATGVCCDTGAVTADSCNPLVISFGNSVFQTSANDVTWYGGCAAQPCVNAPEGVWLDDVMVTA